MATPDTQTFNKYYGNGDTTEFSVGFQYSKQEFVAVYVRRVGFEQVKVDRKDFEFVNDKTIRFPSLTSAEDVLRDGDIITIQRETTVASDYVFSNQKRLFPEDVMDADDLAFEILQEQKRELGRAIIVDPTSEVQPKVLLEKVDLVYNRIDDIETVSQNIVSVDTVSKSIDAVSDVSAIKEEVKDVSDNMGAVLGVYANEESIKVVKENDAGIRLVAGNIDAVLDAPNQAESARVGAESARQSAESAASSAAVANPPPLLTHSWEDHILNDIRYLRADTFSWQNGEFYKAAYEHLVEEYEKVKVTNYYCWGTDMYTKSERPNIGDILYKADGSEWFGPATVATVADDYSYIASTTGPALLDRTPENDIINTPIETIGSHKITYYQAEDGHKIVLPELEATVQAIYEETGAAWYYILDTDNKRFKLPRELPITDKVKGNGNMIYLNNGTTDIGLKSMPKDGVRPNGSLYITDGGDSQVSLTTDQTKSGIISHRENGNGNQYLYFYVGNYNKSAVEQTAGLNAELFNGKVDLNLNNMNPSQSAKETIVGWGMPDYDTLVSKSAGTTYTAEANGFIIWQGKIQRDYSKYTLKINGKEIGWAGNDDWTNNCSRNVYPIKKGDTYISSNHNYFAFCLAVGG